MNIKWFHDTLSDCGWMIHKFVWKIVCEFSE